MITLSVGAKILPTALSNFEDWPSGPEFVLGLCFSIIFSIFSYIYIRLFHLSLFVNVHFFHNQKALYETADGVSFPCDSYVVYSRPKHFTVTLESLGNIYRLKIFWNNSPHIEMAPIEMPPPNTGYKRWVSGVVPWYNVIGDILK